MVQDHDAAEGGPVEALVVGLDVLVEDGEEAPIAALRQSGWAAYRAAREAASPAAADAARAARTAVTAVLGRLPAAPSGGGRVGEFIRDLDAALRV